MTTEQRRWRGEELPQHKLTEENVRAIRELNRTKQAGARRLAAQFGVSRAAIQQVIQRKTWAWVD